MARIPTRVADSLANLILQVFQLDTILQQQNYLTENSSIMFSSFQDNSEIGQSRQLVLL